MYCEYKILMGTSVQQTEEITLLPLLEVAVYGCPSVMQWVGLALVVWPSQSVVSPCQVSIKICLMCFDTVALLVRQQEGQQ